MRTAEEIIAAINPLECDPEPVYLFENGKVRLVTELLDIPVPLEWARNRFRVIQGAKASYARFPLAVAMLDRLEDSLRVALEEAGRAA